MYNVTIILCNSLGKLYSVLSANTLRTPGNLKMGSLKSQPHINPEACYHPADK